MPLHIILADTLPPDTPPLVRGDVYSSSSLEIMWNRGTDDTGIIAYTVYRDGIPVFRADALSYYDTTVSAGITYQYAVSATDAAGNESPQSFPVTLRVPADPYYYSVEDTLTDADAENKILQQPAQLLATATNDQITLQWEAATGPNPIAGYNVYRNDKYIDTVAHTSYAEQVDRTTAHTYYVIAFDTTFHFSARTDSVTVPILPALPDSPIVIPNQLPAQPADLHVESVTSDTAVFGWTATDPTHGYNIYRDDDYIDTTFTNKYSDTRLQPNTAYRYYITAFDPVFQFSPRSAEIVLSTQATEIEAPVVDTMPTAPGAPRFDLISDNRIDVSWPASVDDERILGYNVYRNNDYFTTVFTPRFNDQSVQADTDYLYHVVAFDNFYNYSAASSETTIRSGTSAGAVSYTGQPSAPVNLRELLIGNDWAELRWDPASDDERVAQYRVYRDDVLLYTVTDDPLTDEEKRYASTNSYLDCNSTRDFERCVFDRPSIGSTHSYHVTASDPSGNESPRSNTLTIRLNEVSGADPRDWLETFQLVFAEEFNDESLDPGIWNTRLPWGPNAVINDEQQYYVDTLNTPDFGYDPFKFNGESLTIEGIPTPEDLLDNADSQPFLSGVITTRDSFNIAYGYVEGRIKLAGDVGSLSSFHLFHTWSALNAAEIDIVEYVGQTPTMAYQTYHYLDEQYEFEPHASPTMSQENLSGKWSDEFHIYAVLWEPGLVIWSIDGVEIQRLEGPQISRQTMYIIAYLALGSEWATTPDITAPIFPMRFEIDYIRAYQRPEFIR